MTPETLIANAAAAFDAGTLIAQQDEITAKAAHCLWDENCPEHACAVGASIPLEQRQGKAPTGFSDCPHVTLPDEARDTYSALLKAHDRWVIAKRNPELEIDPAAAEHEFRKLIGR